MLFTNIFLFNLRKLICQTEIVIKIIVMGFKKQKNQEENTLFFTFSQNNEVSIADLLVSSRANNVYLLTYTYKKPLVPIHNENVQKTHNEQN